MISILIMYIIHKDNNYNDKNNHNRNYNNNNTIL